MVTFVCLKCKKQYQAFPSRYKKNTTRTYCSKTCWYKRYEQIITCPCGKQFKAFSHRHRKFCSLCCKMTGSANHNWKGGRKIGGEGYVYVLIPNHPNATKAGYVMEHRLIMEKHLGRFLTKTEVIDHINHNRSDNRIENLQLFSSNGKHLSRDQEIVRFVKTNFASLDNLKKKLNMI